MNITEQMKKIEPLSLEETKRDPRFDIGRLDPEFAGIAPGERSLGDPVDADAALQPFQSAD